MLLHKPLDNITHIPCSASNNRVIFSYTIYCILLVVKNFLCFTSLPSYPKNGYGYQLLQTFIVFMCKNSQKTFTVTKKSMKMWKLFTANDMQYTVLYRRYLGMDLECDGIQQTTFHAHSWPLEAHTLLHVLTNIANYNLSC